jgi:hypothetical protein
MVLMDPAAGHVDRFRATSDVAEQSTNRIHGLSIKHFVFIHGHRPFCGRSMLAVAETTTCGRLLVQANGCSVLETRLRMPTWLQVTTMLLTGGAAGAVINNIVLWRKCRIPSVRCNVSIDSVFNSLLHKDALKAKIEISHEGKRAKFDEVSFVHIELVNDTDKDMVDFVIGVTIEGGHDIISPFSEGSDRHHVISVLEADAAPSSPCIAMDFRCVPFNRKDSYVIRLYVKNFGQLTKEQIKLVTPASVILSDSKNRPKPVTPLQYAGIGAPMVLLVMGFFIGTLDSTTHRIKEDVNSLKMDVNSLRSELAKKRVDEAGGSEKSGVGVKNEPGNDNGNNMP